MKGIARLQAPLLYCLLPLVAGLLLAEALTVAAWIPTVLALPCLLLAYCSVGSPRVWMALICLSFLLLGLGRGLSQSPPENSRYALHVSREAELRVQVLTARPAGEAGFRGLARVIETPRHLVDLQGDKLYVQGGALPMRPRAGDRLRLRAVLKPLNRALGDDSVGFRQYLEQEGVQWVFARARLLEHQPPADLFQAILNELTGEARAQLNRGLEDEASMAGTYRALVLGERTALGRDQRQDYASSGLLHFFAVSGLHVGLVAAMVFLLLRPLPLPPWLNLLLGLSLVLLYVGLTGAQPSAVRAWIMIACLWASTGLRREAAPLNALAFSAILVLWVAPAQLHDPGFQLSYTVVAGILLGAQALTDRWLAREEALPQGQEPRLRRYLLGSLAVSLVAFSVSAPLVATHFGLFSPAAIPGTILLMPLVSALLALGLVSLFTSWIPGLSELFNQLASLLLSGMDLITSKLAQTGLTLERPLPFALGLGLCLLCLALMLLRHLRQPAVHPYWAHVVSLLPLLGWILLAS